MKVNQRAEDCQSATQNHILLQQHPGELIQLHLMQLKCINIQQIGYNYKIPVHSLNTGEAGNNSTYAGKAGFGVQMIVCLTLKDKSG